MRNHIYVVNTKYEVSDVNTGEVICVDSCSIAAAETFKHAMRLADIKIARTARNLGLILCEEDIRRGVGDDVYVARAEFVLFDRRIVITTGAEWAHIADQEELDDEEEQCLNLRRPGCVGGITRAKVEVDFD